MNVEELKFRALGFKAIEVERVVDFLVLDEEDKDEYGGVYTAEAIIRVVFISYVEFLVQSELYF